MTDKDRILNFVNQECDALAEMECVLTEKETESLLNIYPCEDILRQLRKMNNYPKIRKNNRSVYLTCLKWFEMDIAKGYYEKKTRDLPYPSKGGELREEDGSFTSFRMTNKTGMTDKPVTCDEVMAAAAKFLEKFPPGIGFRTKSGDAWRVVNKRIVERASDSKMMTIAEFVSLGILEN